MYRHRIPHANPQRPTYAQVARNTPNSTHVLRNRTVVNVPLHTQHLVPHRGPSLGHPPDEHTRQTAKTYFKIIQAVHHREVTSRALQTGQFPAGMMKQVEKLTHFIKPACPSETTTKKVVDNTKNWMSNNMTILQTHYIHTIDTLTHSLQPHNPDSYTIALGWAHKRYTHKLTHSTLTQVENIIKPHTRIQQTQPNTAHTQHTLPVHTHANTHAHTRTPHTHTTTSANTHQALPSRSHSGAPGHNISKPVDVRARPGLLSSPGISTGLLPTPKIPPLLPNYTAARPASLTAASVGASRPPSKTIHSRSLSLGERPAAFALPRRDPRPPRQRELPKRFFSQVGSPSLPPVLEEATEAAISDSISRPPLLPPPSPPVTLGAPPLPPSASSTPKGARREMGTSPLENYSFAEEGALSSALGHTPTSLVVTTPTDNSLPLDIGGPRASTLLAEHWQNVKSTSLSPTGAARCRPGSRPLRVVMSRQQKICHNNDIQSASAEPSISTPGQQTCDPPAAAASYIPDTPPPITSPCRPVSHKARAGKKILDWNIAVTQRAVILGDSNLARIPATEYKNLQIDSYPGATFYHMKKILEKCDVHPKVETVVLSVGINCKDHDAFQTSFPQLNEMHKEARNTFPNADIYIPLLNFSKFLNNTQKMNLDKINNYIQTHFRYLTTIDPNRFHTDPRDNIHWTHDTATMMIRHWAKQLHFL